MELIMSLLGILKSRLKEHTGKKPYKKNQDFVLLRCVIAVVFEEIVDTS